jgi:hypothetical protein
MDATTTRALALGLMTGGLFGAGACGDDGGGTNILPTTSGANEDTTASSSAGPTTAAEADATADATADTTAGGGPLLPATYRFDCIDVVQMGDGNGDGEPDGEAIQALLLENTWAADIAAFKLNIMLTVRTRDDASGMAELLIGSGIGPDAGNLCTEPTTAADPRPASFEAGVGTWQPSAAAGTCAEPAAGGSFGGTYDFEVSADDTIYIYAQDDDGTVFNCVPGGGAPNAVPLHAIRATVTVDENENVAAGQLSGCLVDAEAQNLCSCLGQCAGSPHASCGGCPNGSVPLAQLLGGVGPTNNCTSIMGQTAYDLTVGFTTRRLAVDEPMRCG